ncbi:MAG TPA: iron-containing alcohol dehydrogenase [Bryobacteraceae bacterium]|nr:iron-containing alcohol dehydrogenase [Bryobacteraceae bacterium]
MRFEFATATRIVFGPGTAAEVAPAARAMGRRALLVTGCSSRLAGLEGVQFQVSGEPTVDAVREGVKLLRAEQCDLVISVGGGSAIDAGKAIAGMAANSGEPLDYLEVVGRGQAIQQPSLPFIAVPTTAGSGTEVTRNAVLASVEHKQKASLRSPLLLARLAVVDPELTYDLPPALTAATGLDALTQLLEPFVSIRSNPMADAFCREGMRRVARSLRTAYAAGRDAGARLDMSLASLFGGLSLANAGLGSVHGFAAPIGGAFTAPHGAVCAALLPFVMDANLRALRSRAPEAEALLRYQEAAAILTGRSGAQAEDGIEWVARLVRELGIPPLGSYGIRPGDVPELTANALQASSTKANPIALTRDELAEVLSRAI